MLREIKGNLFNSKCQTLVNSVNCVGVMGAGVALEFKLRYPAMFNRYVDHCRKKRLTIGKLWLYRTPLGDRQPWVLNFPTKDHWKFPSKQSYLHAGLTNFVSTYRDRGIESIAFPSLGSCNGGIPEQTAIDLMIEYLENIDIDVEIYRYDPNANDDLLNDLKQKMAESSDADFASRTNLQINRVKLLRHTLENHTIRTVTQLATQQGIGEKTLSTVFRTLLSPNGKAEPTQLGLGGDITVGKTSQYYPVAGAR